MFNRGISEDFVQALKKWRHWEEILNDNDLFMAIRDRYVNIYYQGCSIFKISHKNGQLTPETHYKYLVSPNVRNPYVLWKGEHPAVEERVNEILIQVLDLDLLKRSSRWYAEAEKVGLHQILKSNKNVVDVEIALSPESEDEADGKDRAIEGKRAADRIDFAAIQEKDGKPCIVFFEAKRFDNSELRSQTHTPAAIEQTERYKRFIEKHLLEFRESYGKVCKNLVDLGLKRIDPLVKDVAGNPGQLEVDSGVRLVVYGFDEDQKHGKVWNEHKTVLHDHFRDRLLLKGSPSEFTSGISK